jgi:hypothetical protein
MLSNNTRDNILRHFKTTNNLKQTDSRPYKDFTDEHDDNQKSVYTDDILYNTNDGVHKDSSYTYLGEELLDAGNPPVGKAILVEYCVNTSTSKPFLMFNLYNIEKDLGFREIIIKKQDIFKQNENYRGYYSIDKIIYIFYTFEYNEEQLIHNSSDKNTICLVDNICNTGSIYGKKIIHSTRDFLTLNEQFIRLEENGVLIDTPVAGYFGSYWKRIAVTAALGPFVMTPYASLGPYYYFSNYKRAIEFAIIDKTQSFNDKSSLKLKRGKTNIYTKGGVVMFAVFLGRTKVLLNREIDEKDMSKYSQELSKKNTFVDKTMRIRDNDGLWTINYDSVITTAFPDFKYGDLELDLDPQIVIKNFSQQTPVSYVYIDTKDVIETKDETTPVTYDRAKIM